MAVGFFRQSQGSCRPRIRDWDRREIHVGGSAVTANNGEGNTSRWLESMPDGVENNAAGAPDGNAGKTGMSVSWGRKSVKIRYGGVFFPSSSLSRNRGHDIGSGDSSGNAGSPWSSISGRGPGSVNIDPAWSVGSGRNDSLIAPRPSGVSILWIDTVAGWFPAPSRNSFLHAGEETLSRLAEDMSPPPFPSVSLPGRRLPLPGKWIP